MTYKCPKGHDSTDADYCSECGALIGESKLSAIEPNDSFNIDTAVEGASASKELCPDCGTPREGAARFCEVCRHDFQNNKTGVAEAIVASQQAIKETDNNSSNTSEKEDIKIQANNVQQENKIIDASLQNDLVVSQKLNIIISVDKDKASTCDIETAIKPDSVDRAFPLDLDENLVGRRSASKGIYPEIEINDPGVSHRHMKFIKQSDGSFSVLELGSANGTELNGKSLEPGINTSVKPGDEFVIGIWTRLKIVGR